VLRRQRQCPGEPTDQDLIAACRAGETAAWEQVLRRYQRLIYTVPLRFGLSEDEAGDVFQQTCLRLFERLDSLRDPTRLDAWLVSTSKRLSLDALARRTPMAPPATLMPDRADLDPGPEARLELLEEQQRIRRALARLDPRCQALLHWLFYDPDEPSYAHIAERLHLPKNSIGPIRARCFARLVLLLEEQDS
jgi:RNA polymerase sigma factor (sigma-70 family)